MWFRLNDNDSVDDLGQNVSKRVLIQNYASRDSRRYQKVIELFSCLGYIPWVPMPSRSRSQPIPLMSLPTKGIVLKRITFCRSP
jgi:hypothetical protein